MTDATARAGAVLTIDLDAILANWRLVADQAEPGRQCAAVVKADAYGLGAGRVAPALLAAGCTRFFVATLDEAIALRPLLPGAELFVLSGPFPGLEGEFAAHNLIPVLNSPEQVAAWGGYGRRQGRRLPAALHVDTGMSRLGLTQDQAARLSGDRDTLSAIDLVLLMSHLACADEPTHPLNRRQLTAFAAARALFPGLPGSLAASSGVFLGRDWHADWLRPGAALYGIHPTGRGPNPLSPVARLQARIVQLRDAADGATVGYGATHHVSGRARLAVAAAGYADGLFRTLSNRGHGTIAGHRVPLVGRVSMDLVIFDVTAIDPALVHPGGMIELIGPDHTVDEVAAAAGTIGYEILTSLGRRYHRQYIGG